MTHANWHMPVPGDPTFEQGQTIPRGTSGSGERIEYRPVPGVPGALDMFIDGVWMDRINVSDFGAPADRGFAPPAFATTQAGIDHQFRLDMQRAAAGDEASMERLERQLEVDIQLAREGDAAAMERVRVQEMEAFKRSLMNAVAQGVMSERDAQEAFRRVMAEQAGAGARAEMGEFTTRRGQSIGAVQDTFGRLGQLASTPSDFLQLGFNAQGIQAPGSTPTDDVRSRMREFFQQQMDFAGQSPRSFADLFGETSQMVPDEARSFADMFNEARGKVGGFEFGGKVDGGKTPRSAAITGENGEELVLGTDMTVVPRLSSTELRMLRRGGVKGNQFGFGGDDPSPDPDIFPSIEENRRRKRDQARDEALERARRGQGDSVFDLPFLTPGHEQPLFSGGFRRSAAGGVGQVTGLEAIDPLDFSMQSFRQLLPFQQQMMMSQFGENIVGPRGETMRAGIDPATAFEIIRRSSLIGGTRAVSRFG